MYSKQSKISALFEMVTGTADWYDNLAERVGFEPTLEFPLNTLSKRAPSSCPVSDRDCHPHVHTQGGESGIRKVDRFSESASCRFFVADAHCRNFPNPPRSTTAL